MPRSGEGEVRSQYRGVRPTYGGRWIGRITARGLTQYLGTFDDEADAACAYDRRAIEVGRHPNFSAATAEQQRVTLDVALSAALDVANEAQAMVHEAQRRAATAELNVSQLGQQQKAALTRRT